jgi:GTP:adenosylcobinamide-phosphate guanylyltransferase
MAEFSGIHITQSEAVSYIGEISLLYATKETLKTCLKGYLKIEPNPNEAYTQDLKAAMQTIDTAMKEA